MNIKPGIGIYNKLSNGASGISINSGTMIHSQNQPATVQYMDIKYKPKYEEKAYLPNKDWRPLSNQELSILSSNKVRNDHNTVYFGDVPEDLKESFESMKLTNVKHRDNIQSSFIEKPDEATILNQKLRRFLLTLSAQNPFELLFFGANLPNMESIGFNSKNFRGGYDDEHKHFMGLHIDRSKAVDIEEVVTLGNRLCINLGSEDRTLFFVNQPIKNIFNMLKEKLREKQNIEFSNIASLFFKHFPNYPVIRFTQKPYQYYIAPTDNCFHDGSSLGKKDLDITMVFFGKFQH